MNRSEWFIIQHKRTSASFFCSNNKKHMKHTVCTKQTIVCSRTSNNIQMKYMIRAQFL